MSMNSPDLLNLGEIRIRQTQAAVDRFRRTKKLYGTRSKIIHGRWNHDSEIDVDIADTEKLFRAVLRRLLESPELLKTFISGKRDKFLEEFVFSHAHSVEAPLNTGDSEQIDDTLTSASAGSDLA
jgi:hypothetical protein